jgi:pSer/pThr/pTyr-binding forkhead associated (FHA) protein
MDVRLEVVHDKSRVSDVPLRRDTVVGRGKECQLRIPVADVSRRHCQFTLDGERLLIRDLGSSNGTQLADRTIPTGKDVLLSDGDTVTVGPVQFIVHISSATGTPSADPGSAIPAATDLDDTAEFPSFDELADEVTDYVTDEKSPASAPATDAVSDPDQPARPAPESLPNDNALEGDDPRGDDQASVIDLELDTADSADAFDTGDTDADSAITDSADSDTASSADEPAEPPLKSRSLFGLFRRSTRDVDDAEVNDDDLMEEPGEDPPSEMDLPDDGTVGAAQQAQIAFLSVEPSEQSPVEETPPDSSVFDDDIPIDQLADTSAEFEANIDSEPGPIADEEEPVDLDFVDDVNDAGDAPPDDDNLMDFLGQFGD